MKRCNYLEEPETPELLDLLRAEPSIGVVTSLLAIHRTGRELTPGSLETAFGNLAVAARILGVSPDAVHQLMVEDEPSLKINRDAPSFYQLVAECYD